MGSTKTKSTRRQTRAQKSPSMRALTWIDPTASAVHALMPQAEQWAIDCENAAVCLGGAPEAAAADWEELSKRALRIGEKAATARAQTFDAKRALMDTLDALIAVLRNMRARVRGLDSPAEILATIEAIEQVGAFVERKHQSHTAGTCDCEALLGKLDAHHMKHCVDFTTVFPVAEVAADVAEVLYRPLDQVALRNELCNSLRANVLLLRRARRDGMTASADVLARALILSFCRSAPNLGRRLLEVPRRVEAAIEAGAAVGRPRRGARRLQSASDARDALLKDVGLAVSREALRSERKRKKWGAIDAPLFSADPASKVTNRETRGVNQRSGRSPGRRRNAR